MSGRTRGVGAVVGLVVALSLVPVVQPAVVERGDSAVSDAEEIGRTTDEEAVIAGVAPSAVVVYADRTAMWLPPSPVDLCAVPYGPPDYIYLQEGFPERSSYADYTVPPVGYERYAELSSGGHLYALADGQSICPENGRLEPSADSTPA